MRAGIAAMGFLALAACSPGDTRKIEPPTHAAAEPNAAMKETFANCTWGEVEGAGLSIWSYACGPGFGDVRLVADETLPGFALESTGAEGVQRRPVVRVFKKAADAPLDAVLPAVRAASPGPATATCAFAPSASFDAIGHTRFVLEPTGVAKAAWDASVQGDSPGEAPCGDLGVSIVGDRYFEVSPDKQDTVVFVELGSEIQIFDAGTLKAADAH